MWFKYLTSPFTNRYFTSKKAHNINLGIVCLFEAVIGAFVGYRFGVIGSVVGVIIFVGFALVLDRLRDNMSKPIYKKLGFEEFEKNITEAELLKESAKSAKKISTLSP